MREGQSANKRVKHRSQVVSRRKMLAGRGIENSRDREGV